MSAAAILIFIPNKYLDLKLVYSDKKRYLAEVQNSDRSDGEDDEVKRIDSNSAQPVSRIDFMNDKDIRFSFS